MELEFHQLSMKYEALRIAMPKIQARLVSSIATQGQLHPVLVVKEVGEANGFVLIDGYRRTSALRSLNRDTVEAMELPFCESDALIFRHRQENAPMPSALEEGWFLRELIECHGMNQMELSLRLERSESWISRRLSLVRQLPASVQELVRLGKLSDIVAMKYLVPLSRGKKSDCETLAQNLSGHRVSSREMERIYRAWRSGDAEQRGRVVTKPLLFLKAAKEVITDGENGITEEMHAVLDDIEILGVVSKRAQRRLLSLDGDASPEAVWETWQSTRRSLMAFIGAMKERHDAEQRNTRNHSGAQIQGERDACDCPCPEHFS